MAFTQRLIDRYKHYRKQSFLNYASRYQHQYAFVGAGSHSIENLYPCLDYLRVPLKYICTRNAKTATKMAQRYAGAVGTAVFEDVVTDPDVRGVFIAAHPSVHFDLTAQALRQGKAVFVEKPPCRTRDELVQMHRLVEETDGLCLIGLQRRYAPVYRALRKHLKHPHTYTMRYVTGSYPEGDALLDLFIHPLDAVIALFGAVASVTARRAGSKDRHTAFLLAEHESGVLGSLELSTAYTWQSAAEQVTVNARRGVYTLEDTLRLTYTTKPSQIAGIPLEKVSARVPRVEVLFQASSFVPTATSNAVVTHGYFGEIEAFLGCVEEGRPLNRSAPSDLMPTYALLDEVRRLLP